MLLVHRSLPSFLGVYFSRAFTGVAEPVVGAFSTREGAFRNVRVLVGDSLPDMGLSGHEARLFVGWKDNGQRTGANLNFKLSFTRPQTSREDIGSRPRGRIKFQIKIVPSPSNKYEPVCYRLNQVSQNKDKTNNSKSCRDHSASS